MECSGSGPLLWGFPVCLESQWVGACCAHREPRRRQPLWLSFRLGRGCTSQGPRAPARHVWSSKGAHLRERSQGLGTPEGYSASAVMAGEAKAAQLPWGGAGGYGANAPGPVRGDGPAGLLSPRALGPRRRPWLSSSARLPSWAAPLCGPPPVPRPSRLPPPHPAGMPPRHAPAKPPQTPED